MPTRTSRLIQRIEPYLYVAPALLLVLAFKLLPLVIGIQTSLTRPLRPGVSEFVGLANYQRMLSDPAWIASIGNVARLLILLPLFVVVPLIVALLLHLGVRGARYFKAIFFLTWLLPPVIIGYLFLPILAKAGPFNAVLSGIGLGGLARTWLGDPGTALWAVSAVVFWTWFGLGVGVFLAGLATVSDDLFDAARVDGAGFWPMLWRVTVPSMLPTISYWAVLITANMMLGMFGFVYALTGGGPGYSTLLPELYVYNVFSRQLDPGYAAALGVSLAFAIFIVVALQVRLMYSRSADA
jgi:multiple sugar transport system permease protein/raffinose/stachyose/melibiose transport system permease protein